MARIDTLLNAYDDARTGAVSTGFIALAGRQCGVGVNDGVVSVWLAEDTDQERAFDADDYRDPHEFAEDVYDWLGGLEVAR